MRLIGIALVLLVLVAGGWSAFWFYAARQAESGLDAWLDQERTQGRTWTCPDRRIGGFPIALDLSCAQPRFAGIVLGDAAAGSLGGLTLHVALVDPRHALATLTPPLAYRTSDGTTDFAVNWSTLALDLDGVTSGVSAASLTGSALALRGQVGGAPVQDNTAAAGTVTIVKVPDGGGVDFTIALADAGVPALDAVMGDKAPAALDMAGRLTKATLENANSGAELIDRWRQAGGLITFATARITRGPSQVAATGPLHLDEAHRVAGQLDATFIGLRATLRSFGIDPNIATAGSILNGLFGGKRAKPQDDPNTIRLPIAFRNGRLGIGPIVTPIALEPLY